MRRSPPGSAHSQRFGQARRGPLDSDSRAAGMTEKDRPEEGTFGGPEARQPGEEGRRFTVDGETWIARVAGRAGVGTTGPVAGVIAVVHFFRAEEPDAPVRQAYLVASRFEALYEEELLELFRSAKPIPPLEARRSTSEAEPEEIIE